MSYRRIDRASGRRRIIERREVTGIDIYYDEALLDDSLTTIKHIQVFSDSAELSDGFVFGVGVNFSDTAALSDSVSFGIALNWEVSDSAEWVDTFDFSVSFAFSDSAEWGESINYGLLHRFSDSAELSDSVSFGIALNWGVSDSAELDDSGVTIDAAAFDGTVYSVNAETGAASQYSGWAFDSFAQVGDSHYAVDSSGLYLIGGDTDDDADVDCCVRSGYLDFGTEQLKRMDDAIIKGGDFAGQTIVKARVRGGGAVAEHWYLSASDSADARQHVKFGRGLRSDFWQFELCNQSGDDWEFSEARFPPVVLDRRRST